MSGREVFVNAADVGADRGHADLKGFGDFLVELALGEEFEDLFFPRRKPFGLIIGRSLGWRLEGLDDFACDVSGHGCGNLMARG
ncbi:MAG: hypothetical protein MUF31_14605 [Akkermansiaceae bacterium]|nr:hypothetical protein [Akkermansiaceae bacterium]